MKLVKLSTDLEVTDRNEALWVYNGLDCLVTAAAWEETESVVNPHSKLSYDFVQSLRAPALEMMLRGIKVNEKERVELCVKLEGQSVRLQAILDRYADAIWGRGLNPNSPDQLKAFFYGALNLKEQYKYEKGQKKVSTDIDALDKLEVYYYARPIVKVIKSLRDINKRISVLRKGVDPDGRMRTSYNICGTETWRWSSSKNAFGTGDNFQNITDKLRKPFVADPGMKLAYVDLDQAESRAVAYMSGDLQYIEACESGDLHTTVTRMVWPGLKWKGNLKDDRAVADEIFYRWFTYRDMSKRGGHGTNYYGKPPTIARHLKVEVGLIERFQLDYFAAFPGIPDYHQRVAYALQTKGYLDTALGQRRYFHGRLWDEATLREAIAFLSQSLIGSLLNLGMWRVWYHLSQQASPKLWCQLLAQVHDAILIQFPEEFEDEIMPKVLDLVKARCVIGGREMVIPSSAETGWCWSHYNYKDPTANPDGIKGWKGNDERTRQVPAEASLLQIRFS